MKFASALPLDSSAVFGVTAGVNVIEQVEVVFGVCFRDKDGRPFLSCGPAASNALFYKRSEAVAHKRDLRKHGFKGRVVKVRVSYQYAPS